jgi:5-formyltetrahydrofolate cyclo-ligase
VTKKELRIKYRTLRKEITDVQFEKWSDLLLVNFQQVSLPYVSSLLSYIPSGIHSEFNPEKMERYLCFQNPGLRISVPRIIAGSDQMDAVLVNDETEFSVNAFGIAEPVDGEITQPKSLDLVIVPLLAFDLSGHRVGFGKGYYDRYLSNCRSDLIKLGVSFFDAEEEILDRNVFDVPLNYCITPFRVYEF